ncbi:MAG TPA: ABC transporter ATP-binding protein, partial [bacterium (Candidatus Stahlbacteria)]|nr:ABC transporter ATP-binding protein [Candidatus Stahlbacteria bacterium]
ELLVLLGPSGCGKTTLLRCIAGLEPIDQGKIYIGDEEVTDLPPRLRNIAMVFQSYAIFPHMSVFDNIGFGLRIRGRSRDEIEAKVKQTSRLLKIDHLLNRYPAEISGGENQRVAVARALILDPHLILMDEPLSNLDAMLRLKMRTELKRIHQELKMTVIYVTHDQIEALSLGDRIGIMKDGRIIQIGTPCEIFDQPETVFVAEFIGMPPMNILKARCESDGIRIGELFIPLSVKLPGPSVLLGIRAEHITVTEKIESGMLKGRILVREMVGVQDLLTIDIEENTVKVLVDAGFKPRGMVGLRLNPGRIHLFDPESGHRLLIR